MKFFVILLVLFFINTPKEISTNISESDTIMLSKSILKNDLNQSIIDGFFDGDTTGKNLTGYYFVQ